MTSKILIWDIEMSGHTAHVWGTGDQYVRTEQLLNDKFILSIAYRWYGEKEIHTLSCNKTELAKRDDSRIVKKFSRVLQEADWNVYHNGDSFDIKEFNTKILKHELPPISPKQSIDTCKMARKYFRFNTNKLDDICQELGIGQKISTNLQLWLNIVHLRDMKSMERMVEYNIHDVKITTDLFERILPYLELSKQLFPAPEELFNLDELQNLTDSEVCNNCGFTGEHKTTSKYVTASGSLRYYYKCGSCGAHGKVNKLFRGV